MTRREKVKIYKAPMTTFEMGCDCGYPHAPEQHSQTGCEMREDDGCTWDGKPPTEEVIHVAKALINEDLDSFGSHWPWPEGDEEYEIRARRSAYDVAKVAIKAVRSFDLNVGGSKCLK